MKILVTGANGYLGKGVVKKLLDDGVNVIATDLSSSNIDKRATIVLGSIFDMRNPFVELCEPDVVLHMAWRDGFIHNSPSHINDLPKHVSFLNSFIDSGVKQLAVMGSMHEIGFYEGCISEGTPCNPESLYGVSKNALRIIMKLACANKGVLFQWLRGFYIVGNTVDGNSVFSKIMQASERGEKEFPFTSGLNQYDFIEYDSFCNYVAKTVEQKRIGGIINICSGWPEKLSDRVQSFIADNKLDIHLLFGAYPDRPYDSKAIWGDNTKIKEIMANEE